MIHTLETVAQGIIDYMATHSRRGEGQPYPFCSHFLVHEEDCLYLAVVLALEQEQEGGLQVAIDHAEAAFQALRNVWPKESYTADTVHAIQYFLQKLIHVLERVQGEMG